MLPAAVCGPPRIEVPAGSTRVVLAPAPAFRGVRVALRGRAIPPPTVTAAGLTDTSPVERQLTVPSSRQKRIAAVRENQNLGWVASVPRSGRASRVTVDGWQQGWLLSGHVEQVQLTYAPDRLYRLALAVGAVLVLLMVAAGVWLRRRPGEQPSLGSRSVPPWLLATGGVLSLGMLAGWAGLACGAVAVAAAPLIGRGGSGDRASWLSGMLVAGAALFYWRRPLGSAAGWAGTLTVPQLLVVGALGVLLGVLLSTDLRLRGFGGTFRRRAGRSTSR
jgi:arabinofuranan 3-O-arabinosyltransferase